MYLINTSYKDNMKNRNYRRRHSSRRVKKYGLNRVGIYIMAICFAVLAGYATSTYIIGPAMGLDVQPAFFDSVNEEKDEKNNDTEDKEATQKTVLEDTVEKEYESGFAVQYGSFSSKEGAQQCVENLKAKGIDVSIIEKDGSYKVIGEVYKTKDEARLHKDASSDGDDIFITEIP